MSTLEKLLMHEIADQVLVDLPTVSDEYILTELNELSTDDWWDTCVDSEAEEVYWTVYYSVCEEVAIQRGLTYPPRSRG